MKYDDKDVMEHVTELLSELASLAGTSDSPSTMWYLRLLIAQMHE